MDSYFEKGVKIKGTLWVKGAVHFDGEMEGDVHSSNHFVVGKTGKVSGTIHSYNVSNMGTIEGDIMAENKVTLLPESKLTGDISTYRLVIDEGSSFEGSSKMTEKKPKEIEGALMPATPVKKEDIAIQMVQKEIQENKAKKQDGKDSADASEDGKGWGLKGWGSKTGMTAWVLVAAALFMRAGVLQVL